MGWGGIRSVTPQAKVVKVNVSVKGCIFSVENSQVGLGNSLSVAKMRCSKMIRFVDDSLKKTRVGNI